jgi:lipoic acid synthetase
VEHGKPEVLAEDEPERVMQAAREMDLDYVVITSVTRDDLPDGGASHFAETVRCIREWKPGVGIELLVPDFRGQPNGLNTVLEAGPDVLNHNLETVKRMQAEVRPQASYETSLAVLREAVQDGRVLVKSGLMVGLGETDEELYEAMDDLLEAGCQILTLGQYLAPSRNHAPVDRFVHPDVFEEYARVARERGFVAVASAPLVRSSYQADQLRMEALAHG